MKGLKRLPGTVYHSLKWLTIFAKLPYHRCLAGFYPCLGLANLSSAHIWPICFQCTLSLTPENIRKPYALRRKRNGTLGANGLI